MAGRRIKKRYPIKKVFYEVYDNRAILEPIDNLPLLDRCTNRHRGIESATEWVGSCVRVECIIHGENPLVRTITSTKLIYFFRPAEPEDAAVDRINIRTLRGRWTKFLGPAKRRFPRRK